MAVDKKSVVDMVVSHPETNEIFLIITDHTVWGISPMVDKNHMFQLQEKVKTYLKFITSGELYEKIPEARGRTVAIGVAGSHPFTAAAQTFCDQLRQAVGSLGYRLEFHAPGTGPLARR